MPRLLFSDLPFALASGTDKTTGFHAERRADGSVGKLAYWRDGALVAQLVVVESGAWLEKIERFEPCDDGGDDSDPDGFKAWAGDVLRRLSQGAERILVCAFCEKTSFEVAKLIMGPREGICNECIKVCADIVAEEPTRS